MTPFHVRNRRAASDIFHSLELDTGLIPNYQSHAVMPGPSRADVIDYLLY